MRDPAKQARYPMPAYPRGWYSLCDSDELARDEIRTIPALGREFVAVRDESGAAKVYDAYCPHLGAHLGHGGRLEGGRIHCPFHGWQFSAGDGRCAAVPYAKRIPQGAALGAWPTDERNGLVMIYFDADRKEPEWFVDDVPELHQPEWFLAANLAWTFPTHAHEVLENVFDTAHLRYVHGADQIPCVQNVEESPGKVEYEIRGDGDDPANDLDVTLWGLGVQRLHYKIQVPLFELDTLLPIDEDRCYGKTRLYIRDLGSTEANEMVAGEVAKELDRQVEADIAIFAHKRHIAEPILCDGDGPIPVFRRWTQQFYA